MESLDRFPYFIDRIEPAKETLRGEGFYDLEAYKESLFLIDKWLEVLSSLYFPTQIDGRRQSVRQLFDLFIQRSDEDHQG